MSIDVYNARIAKLAKTLPGRNENNTDISRGYVGWGPYEDAMSGDGKTVEHEDWQALLGAIQTPVREIHDYYFEHNTPSKECPCCDASGKNKDYAELAEGFYRYTGTGRWKGWGEGKLYQNEIDELIKQRRIYPRDGETVTPENFNKYLGRMGHDAINRWILIPLRAKNIGIDDNDCYECVGTGYIPTDASKIVLNIWTFDAEAGTSRADVVNSIKPEEIDEVREFLKEAGWEAVKKRFGWATGDNMHPEIWYEENFKLDPNRPFQSRGWSSSMKFESFGHFCSEFGINGDPDLNLIFDYQVIADRSHFNENPFAASELPEEFTLKVLMTHPRKSTDRHLVIHGCTPENGEMIKEWLNRSFEVHGRHFAWAADRKFGNEAELDKPERDTGSNFLSRF